MKEKKIEYKGFEMVQHFTGLVRVKRPDGKLVQVIANLSPDTAESIWRIAREAKV